ncbi:MAG: MFS family permease [Francisellaceae bacterium]|jgi:MFS family permease
MQLSYRYLIFIPMLLQASYWGMMKVALPILPSLPEIFNTSDHTVQMIVSLSFILSGLSPLFWGPLIDAMKFKKFIVLVVLFSIVTLFITASAKNIYIFGFFYISVCMLVCALSVCARSFPFIYLEEGEKRRKSISLLIFGGYTGAFLTPYFSGWVSAEFGWRYVFGVISVLLLLIFSISLMLKDKENYGENRHFISNIKNMFQHFKIPSFRNGLIVSGSVSILGQSYLISIPFWLSRVHQVPSQDVANYLLPMLLPGMILPFFFPYIMRKFSDKFLMHGCLFILITAGFLCFILYLINDIPLWAWVIPGVLLNITAVGIFPILSINMFRDITKNISAASGFTSLVAYLSGGIGMYISIYISLDTFYLECIFILLMSLIFYLCIRSKVYT